MTTFKHNFGSGLALIFDSLSRKIKDKINYDDKILVPHIIIVEYNRQAQRKCIQGEEFLLFKHYIDTPLSDIKSGRFSRAEPFSYALLEYYKSQNILIVPKDNPHQLPRSCLRPTQHEASTQLF